MTAQRAFLLASSPLEALPGLGFDQIPRLVLFALLHLLDDHGRAHKPLANSAPSSVLVRRVHYAKDSCSLSSHLLLDPTCILKPELRTLSLHRSPSLPHLNARLFRTKSSPSSLR